MCIRRLIRNCIVRETEIPIDICAGEGRRQYASVVRTTEECLFGHAYNCNKHDERPKVANRNDARQKRRRICNAHISATQRLEENF